MFHLKRLYHWTLTLANKPYALWALILVAFTESVFFPIPPDILLIPLVLGSMGTAKGHIKWWLFPMAATIASAAGGIFGYGIGALLMESVGQDILAFFHYDEHFANLQKIYSEQGIIFLLIAGLTPIPYKVFTILSGAVGMSLPVFIVGSIAVRGLRFFALALLLRLFGEPIKNFINKYFNHVAIIGAVVLIGGIILLRMIRSFP